MKKWHFVFAMVVLAVACTTPQPMNEPSTLRLLIGTYTTNSSSEGIYTAEFDPATGDFSNLQLAAQSLDPSYLVPTRDSKVVYAVNEQDGGSVSVFQWSEGGTLDLVETKGSAGVHPCHISINADNNLVAVANYTSGDGAIFPLADGRLGEARPYEHEGSGPNAQRQEGPHAHFNTFKNGYLYVVDLGTDHIMKYQTGGRPGPLEGSVAHKMEPGDGPRHLEFHPTRPLVFVANELSNTIMSLNVTVSADFEPISRLEMLPSDFEGDSKAADIHVSPDGKYVYASNRGYHSIAIFRILEDGSLEAVGHETRGIDTPRNFVISPDGSFMLVGNQGTDTVIAFRIDKATGQLTPFGSPLRVGKPVCLKFY